MKNIFLAVHEFGMRHTKFRAMFGSSWRNMKELLWSLRCRLFVMKPISFVAGKYKIFMLPLGQIARVMWEGRFEVEERDFAVHAIKPGMLVLNIGANAGLYTLIASKQVEDTGQVHAFEPSSQNFNLLSDNIALNGCGNVMLNNFALANFQGKLSLNRDPHHPKFDGHFFVSQISESPTASSDHIEVIPCITLDEYWDKACGGFIRPVDLIIIDVEGAELSVFEGARKAFAASPDLVMILECTKNLDHIKRFLSDFDFSFYKWNIESKQLEPCELNLGSFIAQRNGNTSIIS